ncbi:tyrosine-type recombinase/integrase [Clostridium sp. C2-6-12]|uniref:tyrosine-type recombinase/integrase n=1 Tax=Clostridium sp. C2-6-12 TaxID=2698832 RepID=UPI00136B0658|nr:tyrosine-type recombinase/integrase [Clostridium sp. C2-6-12]
MATKKSNGEGSINRYKNGWRGTITIGRSVDGKLIRKQVYGKTKHETIEKMNEFRDKNKRGLIPKNDKITLNEWFKTWLFDFKANEIKASTIQRYDVIYRNYIENSELAGIKLKDLNAITIQNYYNNLIKMGKTPTAIKILNKALKSCLKYAKKINYIVENCCDNVILPKIPYGGEDKVQVFTLEEQKQFMEIIKNHKHRLEFILTLGTGLRIGELVALKWDNVDFESGNLKVNKSIWRGYTIIEGKRKFVSQETTPKTPTSIREVAIPNKILEELKIHKEKQDEIKEKYKEVYNDKGYIFANIIGEHMLSDTLSRSFVKVLKDNGIKHLKFHALRHTYATRLFEKSVQLKTVQKLLGHSSIEITADIYTHVMDSEKISAVQKLNDLFEE